MMLSIKGEREVHIGHYVFWCETYSTRIDLHNGGFQTKLQRERSGRRSRDMPEAGVTHVPVTHWVRTFIS